MLVARHSIIRNSSKDGVRFDSNAGGSVLESQITGNALYGVRNATTNSAVLATNNWWGDPTGPHSDLAPACGTGAGDNVTAGVLFVPFLTSTVANVDFPLSNAPVITLTPRRWFAPADNLTKVYFDITLTDGNGAPLPGRTVKLKSNLGTVTDGGITDITGKTLAYLLSAGTGDALVTATLDAASACEYAMSPQSKITFTTPLNLTELFPEFPGSLFGQRYRRDPAAGHPGRPGHGQCVADQSAAPARHRGPDLRFCPIRGRPGLRSPGDLYGRSHPGRQHAHLQPAVDAGGFRSLLLRSAVQYHFSRLGSLERAAVSGILGAEAAQSQDLSTGTGQPAAKIGPARRRRTPLRR